VEKVDEVSVWYIEKDDNINMFGIIFFRRNKSKKLNAFSKVKVTPKECILMLCAEEYDIDFNDDDLKYLKKLIMIYVADNKK
jgi:hypothetical protein